MTQIPYADGGEDRVRAGDALALLGNNERLGQLDEMLRRADQD